MWRGELPQWAGLDACLSPLNAEVIATTGGFVLESLTYFELEWQAVLTWTTQ